MNKIEIISKFRSVLGIILPAVSILIIFKAVAFLYAPAPINHQELEKAQLENQSILLEFHASWCSTCIIQRNVINSVFKDPKYSHIRRFTLNFDKEIELKNTYRVSSQSTLVLLKGKNEVALSVGMISSTELELFLNELH